MLPSPYNLVHRVREEEVAWYVVSIRLEQRFKKLSTWCFLHDDGGWSKHLMSSTICPHAIPFRIKYVLKFVMISRLKPFKSCVSSAARPSNCYIQYIW